MLRVRTFGDGEVDWGCLSVERIHFEIAMLTSEIDKVVRH